MPELEIRTMTFSLGRNYLGMLGTEPRGLCMLGKISTMAPTPDLPFTFYFQIASHQVTQVGLELAILLSQPPRPVAQA